jgi:hypothetical protein
MLWKDKTIRKCRRQKSKPAAGDVLKFVNANSLSGSCSLNLRFATDAGKHATLLRSDVLDNASHDPV